jgi:hypothetical protein
MQKRRPNPSVDKALTAFEQEMGGREAVIEVLAHAPVDEEVQYLMLLLGDPSSDTRSLASLCIDGDIEPGKLLSLIRDGEMSKAQARSLRRVAKLLPDVAEDTMKRALPMQIRCPDCGGTKNSCVTCGGRGSVEKEPSLERQKTALELGGLLKKQAPINIQQNQFQGVMAASLREFQVKSDKVLYDHDAPVDAEVLEE